jgi:hypothetical protein
MRDSDAAPESVSTSGSGCVRAGYTPGRHGDPARRRDSLWFLPAIVAALAMAVPGAMTIFVVGLLYTFGMDSCGPGSGSGQPCPDPVNGSWAALWGAALGLWCMTLVLPGQTWFRVPRWLFAAAAVALAWLVPGTLGKL